MVLRRAVDNRMGTDGKGELGKVFEMSGFPCPNWVSLIREEAGNGSKGLNLGEHRSYLGTGCER